MATATLTVSASAPVGYKYVEIVTPDLSNTLGIAYSLSPTLATSDLIVFNKWYQADGVTTSWSVTISTNGVPQFSHISGTQSLTFNYFIWDESASAYGTTAAYSIAYTEIQVQPRVNNIWQWLQAAEPTPGGVTDKIQKYLTSLGYTGSTNESLYRWLGARGYEGSLADRIYQFEYFNTFRYIDISAKLVLEKFGTDAHVWLPGIGYFNGLEAGNYIDSAGTQAGLVDNPVGLANDAVGAITATQGTTANKPILRRGAVNLLTNSVLAGGTSGVIGSGAVAPTGWIFPAATGKVTYSGQTTRFEATAQRPFIGIGIAANTAAYILSARIESGSSSRIDDVIGVSAGTAVISAITFKKNNVSVTALEPVSAGDIVSALFTVTTAGSPQFRIGLGCSGTSTGDITMSSPQLELGSTASEYIPTTTAAASSSSGNYYWQFDGSNDSLALSSVPFVATDDLCVVLAARTNEQAATARTAFGFSGAAGQRMAMIYNESGYWYLRFVDDAAATYAIQTTTQLSAGSIRVVSARKSSNVRILRLNGAQEATSNTPVGTTTVTGGSIGARDAASAAPYLGSIYPVIAIKGTISDADLLVLERWVGSLSGVSI